jgi:hypothetical protein
MDLMNKFKKISKIWTASLLCMAVLLLFSGLFIPTGVAIADWQDDYSLYVSSLPSTDNKDWYLGENYLNVEGAKAVVDRFLADPNFDKEALAEDPIVIAVIDSGIGFAYKVEGDAGIPLASTNVYDAGAKYRLHSIFDDVLLTDDEGNYVYKNFATTVEVKDGSRVLQTINAVTDSGDIALDLVDNTSNDHGTHVTGTVAMLIHMLGLEDYVKILPIKANSILSKETSASKTDYLAAYTNSQSNPVITDAVQFAYDNGADIVSMSLSATESSKEAFNFVDYADKMLFVAAAGNKGTNTKTYPAAYDNVVGVMNYGIGTLQGTSQLSSRSNYGSWFDVSAPGTDVISSINSGAYGKLTGTSMATPMVSFAGALAYLRYRGYDNYNASVELTVDVVRNMLSHGVSHKTSNALITKQVPALCLTDVLTYNFYGDINFINKIMGEPEAVDIVADGRSEFKLGKGDKISLAGKLAPTNSRTTDNLYWWYEIGGEEHPIGYGWTIDFDVPDKVGMYQVKCAIVNSNNERYCYFLNPYEFSVVYCTPNDVEVQLVPDTSTDNFMVGSKYTFSLPTEDMNPSVTYEVVWYVNGIEAGRGVEFEFEPQEEDDYAITISVNGEQLSSIYNVKVLGHEDTPYKPPVELIAGIVIVATGGLAGIIILIVRIVKQRNNRVA